MKYGIREICDVVFKAKTKVQIGKTTFEAGAPVIYFDTLKTSSMEGAATTVYAQGGKGNSRLMAWEGERTVTFTMEDALISELGLSVLTGAGLIDPVATGKPLKIHSTARFEPNDTWTVYEKVDTNAGNCYIIGIDEHDNVIQTIAAPSGFVPAATETSSGSGKYMTTFKKDSLTGDKALNEKVKTVMLDFYVEKAAGAKQIEITADKFAGTYYVEASTLFRDSQGGDHPAEFVIPNAKLQSNFNFSLASTGDPSTFTFTMDAFPDYTKFDTTKKVFAAIQVVDDEEAPLADKNETDN